VTVNGDRHPTRILLVEDDPDQTTLVRIMLETALGPNHEFVHADRIVDALDRLAEQRITCVLLDLSLPDARELEGLLTLRNAERDVPIVVLSARTAELLAVQAVQEGAQDYLVKGRVDPGLMGRAIRYAIARKATEIESRNEAMRDSMTGLPNRALLRDRLDQVLARSRRLFSPFAVLFMDLDGFKEINDRYGHSAGDQALVQVANRIRTAIREADTPARYGGDEFVVLCEKVKSEEEAAEIADRISKSIEEPLLVEGAELRVGVSIGIAIGSPSVTDADVLIREADAAMYGAKNAGLRYQLTKLA
jgi:two-component system cell cycle response regulator